MISGHIDDWREKAVDYLDGRLDSTEKAAVEQHLADCPACANRMSAQQGVIEFLRAYEEASPPQDLKERILGQFPQEAPASGSQSTRMVGKPSLWRRFRPWIPVTTSVVALFACLVAYGLVHESRSSGEQVADNVGKYAAAQTTILETQQRVSTGDSQVSGSGASSQEQGTSAKTAIKDKKSMVSAMKTATKPVFVSFQATSADNATVSPTTTAPSTDSSAAAPNQAAGVDQTSTTATTVQSVTTASLSTDKVQSLVAQLGDITGLDQLSSDQSVGGPTFAFYVSKDQLDPLLDLLYQLKNSEDVDLALHTQPDASYAGNAGTIVQRKAELPVLKAEDVPQPATSKYKFTTSTLAPKNDKHALSVVKTPDSDGSHVLVVISVEN